VVLYWGWSPPAGNTRKCENGNRWQRNPGGDSG
jgi:hypothetical protein